MSVGYAKCWACGTDHCPQTCLPWGADTQVQVRHRNKKVSSWKTSVMEKIKAGRGEGGGPKASECCFPCRQMCSLDEEVGFLDSFHLSSRSSDFGENLLQCLVLCATGAGDPAECPPPPLWVDQEEAYCLAFHCLPDQQEPWVGEREPAFTIKLH